MAVIDEEGRLFGAVNVVDALVVLLLAAMLLAGVALVTSEDGDPQPTQPEPTRYATVTYTVPLGSDAATLAANETLRPRSGGDALVVRDVYRSFSPDGTASVAATVSYSGTLTVGGDRAYGGDSVALVTGSRGVDARVLAVNRSDDTIPTRSERVVLLANVTSSAAGTLEAGTTARIGETAVATITAVEVRSSDGDHTQVAVGAELTVWDRSPVAHFGGGALRYGNDLTVVTDSLTVPGYVAEIGTDDPATVTGREP